MTATRLASAVADSASCDQYQCGHISRSADRHLRYAGILFRVLRAGGALPADVPAPTLAALALMRQGSACQDVAGRYRDPINGRCVKAPEQREVVGKLTPDQIRVLNVLAHGHSAGEAGELLFLDPETVKSHRKNIIRRMGVHTFADAVAEAVRRELITL